VPIIFRSGGLLSQLEKIHADPYTYVVCKKEDHLKNDAQMWNLTLGFNCSITNTLALVLKLALKADYF